MTNKSFHDKIVKLLPSQDLKTAVKAQGFTFKERDLLKLIDLYAPTFVDKLKLFGEAAVFSEKGNIAHAKKLILFNERKYDKFMTPSADEVYEVDIKCDPLDNEGTYIVRTFEDALATIRAFLKYYKDVGARDKEWSSYTVTKKTVGAPSRPKDIWDKIGETGSCTLGKGLKIKSVDAKGLYTEFPCAHYCDRCKHECISTHEIEYPAFLEKYELVAFSTGEYRRTGNGAHSSYTDIEYGINSFGMDKAGYNVGCACVVELDNEYIKQRKADQKDENGYYRVYDSHCHPEFAEIFKPDPSELPKELYEDYLYAVEVLKKIDEER